MIGQAVVGRAWVVIIAGCETTCDAFAQFAVVTCCAWVAVVARGDRRCEYTLADETAGVACTGVPIVTDKGLSGAARSAQARVVGGTRVAVRTIAVRQRMAASSLRCTVVDGARVVVIAGE